LEPSRTLSVKEFTNLAAERSESKPVSMGEEGTKAVLMYHAFDYEEAPTEGDWMALGLIYARTTTAGGPVVGGVLWGKSVSAYPSGGDSFTMTAKSVDLLVAVEPTPAPGATETYVCQGRFRASLNGDGVLIAGGKVQGSLARTKR